MKWHRKASLAAKAALVLLLVVAVVLSPSRLPSDLDLLWPSQRDASLAIQAMQDKDLDSLHMYLGSHRGDEDFAYFFAERAKPRELGDAIAMFADVGGRRGFPAEFDAERYELFLVDLAGTLSLATQNASEHALPDSWAESFVAATTDPTSVSKETGSVGGGASQIRVQQDQANAQNLLLLLARGFWSTEFLQRLTSAYWKLDQRQSGNVWPTGDFTDAKYAPAPNGVYLTDGIIALSAALTANPAASEWAFTDFLPGTQRVEGSELIVGKFTHFLFFEHQYPEAEQGAAQGVTAPLTALDAAIASMSWSQPEIADEVFAEVSGPAKDSLVLQRLAKHERACSLDPGDYWDCVLNAADFVTKIVVEWMQTWGHIVLEILTLATFAPPPFNAVGVAAAAANASWYAIDGDYAAAGLSLAAAVPGLAFLRLAKLSGAGVEALRRALQSTKVAKLVRKLRDATYYRSYIRKAVRSVIEQSAQRDVNGNFVDPNTGKVIIGKPDLGHKPGYEWRCMAAMAARNSWTQAQLNEYANDPKHYQLEDRASNRSHAYEGGRCKV